MRFNAGSKKLKLALWRKNVILIVAIVVVSIIALWLILSFACGFDFHKCGAGGGSPPPAATTTTAPTTHVNATAPPRRDAMKQ